MPGIAPHWLSDGGGVVGVSPAHKNKVDFKKFQKKNLKIFYLIYCLYKIFYIYLQY